MCRFPPLIKSALIGLLLALTSASLLAGLPFPQVGAQETDEEKLDRFLERLGLVDLQILHLEQRLDQASGEQQKDLAQRLADLYAGRLMNSADDESQYQETLESVKRLLSRFPQADTPALQVMLLQADYNRAEAHVSQWLSDPSDAAARSQAQQILSRIAPKLDEHRRELNKTIERLLDEIDKLPEGDQLQAKEQELDRRQAVAGRAEYFAAWSKYYLGIIEPAPTSGSPASGQKLFAEAAEMFRRLLQIPQDADLKRLDASELQLDSAYRARSAIGLGMALVAKGAADEAATVFAWLEHASVPPAVQDQASYWHVQGLLNAQLYDRAARVAESRIKSYEGDPTPGKVSLCVALVRTAFGPDAPVSEQMRSMGMLGISGLARLRQLSAVRKLVEKHEIPLESDQGFYLRWIQGQQQFAEAKKTNSREGFLQAAQTLQAALNSPEAENDVASAAACRYELGACYYYAEEFERAARQFREAYAALKAYGHENAPLAAWMAFAAFQRAGQASHIAAAIETLNTLKHDYPQHEYAKKADYFIAKLRQAAGSPADSIERLMQIQPGDPNYLPSRYDLCSLLREQLPPPGDSARAAEIKKLQEVVQEVLGATGASAERQAKCALGLVEAALESEPPDQQLASRTLAAVAPLVSNLSDQSSAAAEYHYRSLQLARLEGDDTARRGHAQWLVEKAPGSAYELPALIVSARALEQRLQSASPDERDALFKEAHGLYQRLTNRLGDSAAAIASSKNARVANSRLAHYAFEMGQFARAAATLDQLLAVELKNKDYLRRAGLARFRAGQYQQAIPHWRTLLLGLPRGTDGWLEAKYYQLASLAKSDPEEAKKAFKNFKIFYPDYGSAEWRDKFRALEKQL